MPKNNGYIHKQGLVYKNRFHVVFCPKYRRRCLTGDIEKRLRELIYEIAEKNDIEIHSLEIMPDHVHMFIEFDPRIALHKAITVIKGSTSRTLREEFPSLVTRLPSLWTRNYFSCSIGDISDEAIKDYISSQQKN